MLNTSEKIIKKALLCYPPVGLYQRSEERCQADIEGSTTQAPHAPNDLGYLAAVLEKAGVKPVIRDYPVEKLKEEDVLGDIKSLAPEIIVISTTSPTFPRDIEFLSRVKSLLPNVITIAKGSCFWSIALDELKNKIYRPLDIAIYGEAEFIIDEIMAALRDGRPLEAIGGIIVNIGTEYVARTAQPDFREDLDALPFPRRDLIRNELYKNPLTDKPMATIIISRGCPAQCIFCLTPVISGYKVRKRSIMNIMEELKECVEKYGIKDFFFRADTFTIDKNYAKILCKEIINQGLKIDWVANSRADTIDEELLGLMKKAGCWLVAFGIESGNSEIQKMIKKGASIESARQAVKLTREAGLKVFGFFMVGFPWDTELTLKDTLNLSKELDCDFIEVHIAVPFDGTPLNSVSKALGLIKEPVVGYNYFSRPYSGGTLHLTKERVVKFRKKMLWSHYLRVSYTLRTLKSCRSPRELINYYKYGLRLAKNILKTR